MASELEALAQGNLLESRIARAIRHTYAERTPGSTNAWQCQLLMDSRNISVMRQRDQILEFVKSFMNEHGVTYSKAGWVRTSAHALRDLGHENSPNRWFAIGVEVPSGADMQKFATVFGELQKTSGQAAGVAA